MITQAALSQNLKKELHDLMQLKVTSYERGRLAYRLLEELFEALTAESGINFISLFTRMTYASQVHQIPKNLIRVMHLVRKVFESGIDALENHDDFESTLLQLLTALSQYLESGRAVGSIQIPDNLNKLINQEPYERKSFAPLIEGIVVSENESNNTLTFISERQPDVQYLVQYDVDSKNQLFTKNIIAALKVFPKPFPINLIDVDVLENDVLIPSAFVIYPDYLVDVTTIANIHGDKTISPWIYLVNKFKPHQISPPLMIGNTVNFFLDQLIKDSTIEMSALTQDIFALDTLSWVLFDDATIEEVMSKLKMHFDHLQRTIVEDFPKKGIEKGKIYLEPTFYCRDYGVQGRLDLFHIDDKRTKAEIIELKSTKPFKPNKFGISQSHYVQTMLYEMIIKSTYRGQLQPINFILYSALGEDNMKLAYGIRELNYEIIKTRNEIVTIEFGIANDPELVKKVFKFLKVENQPGLKGFLLQDLKLFEEIYTSLDEVEKIYFERFSNFIAREHLLAKTGEHGLEKANGLSGLWLETVEEKADRFAIYNHLQIEKNDSDDPFPVIKLKKTKLTAALANFRIGDIAVLYPHQHNARQVLHHEIFKCTVLELGETYITIRMRHPQLNQHLFKTTGFWNLEADVLDSSFRHMYRNLFDFASATKDKREILLGRKRPAFNEQETQISIDDVLTVQQKMIVRKIIQTKDYLLLWGPPGTGKTSIIIKHAARHLFMLSETRICYLAYTNRAVDEICDALESAGLKKDFIRIGSKYSVDQNYVDNLLDEQIKGFKTRAQILQKLKSTRIYVSTISSMQGKPELFELLKFDMAIVDEASQILEPAIIGLLTNFDRFVLIGDHNQLPAVVTQNEKLCDIKDDLLLDNGIVQTSMSFFERLYRQCSTQNWTHVLEILNQQGRMHETLMAFPKMQFYKNKLEVVPGVNRLIRPMTIVQSHRNNILTSQRLIFIETPVDNTLQWKLNTFEADVVASLINQIRDHYRKENLHWHKNSVGVITPYKAQIALIKSKIPDFDEVTVDSVERYQGGARDIILFSICTNKPSQMNALVSLNADGVDRKLNVAITRAREQLIIIGNREILEKDKNYKALISQCVEL